LVAIRLLGTGYRRICRDRFASVASVFGSVFDHLAVPCCINAYLNDGFTRLRHCGAKMNLGGISIHAFDVSRGIAAAGLRVELKGPDGELLADGKIGAAGALDHPIVRGDGLTATGTYEAVFHIGDWYRAQGVAVPAPAFLEVVPYRFGVADLAQHYHLPLKMTPWGFSLFRGGA